MTGSRGVCLHIDSQQRGALGPMHEGRVDVIGGGAIIVEELAYALGSRARIDRPAFGRW